MTVNYLDVPNDIIWNITEGIVEVSVNDGYHSVNLSNIVADGNLINGALMVDFQ